MHITTTCVRARSRVECVYGCFCARVAVVVVVAVERSSEIFRRCAGRFQFSAGKFVDVDGRVY